MADRKRVAQVCANLLSYALRHTDEGGHVEVAVKKSATAWTLSVTDDGEGIELEHLARSCLHSPCASAKHVVSTLAWRVPSSDSMRSPLIVPSADIDPTS